MAAVGSAVGLGNIWRFPYETGQHGGAAFLLVYLGCVLFLGTPLMIAELSLGRATRANIVGAFRKLSPHGYWWLTGVLGMISVLFVVGFYAVVSGWTLHYTLSAATGTLAQQDFQVYSTEVWRPLICTWLFLLINLLILLGGVQKGIERASNILTPLLGVLLVLLSVRSLLLPHATTGLRYLFGVDFSQITPEVVVSAMGQSFFSISMGVGTLLIYGSYLPKDTKIGRTSLSICLIDTLIAILAGLIIFPACFSFGIQPDAGPGLAFITLPSVFLQITGGEVWSLLFFLLLLIAALTSSISMLECPIAILQEERQWSRTKAVGMVTGIAFVLTTLCALSLTPDLGKYLTVSRLSLFDFFDKITANLLMPTGGLLIALFVGWRMDKELLHHTLTNHGKDSGAYIPFFLFFLRYIAPLCIMLIFIQQISN